MTTILRAPIVGMHFRPPAKLVLESLPGGAKLVLMPQPDNPYDANAVRVLCRPEAIPEGQHEKLAAELPGFGGSLEELIANGTPIDEGGFAPALLGPLIWLGFVAASEGKPLAKLNEAQPAGEKLVGSMEIARACVWARGEPRAKLGFATSGVPLVLVESEEEPR